MPAPGDEYKHLELVKERAEPDLRCLSYTHDRDYKKYKTLPEGKEIYARKAWYPPQRLLDA
eukprot:scaffold8103_cov403-Prasinococcus_capsulatus_cf.AAC.8